MESKKETGPDNFDNSPTVLGSAELGVTNIVVKTDFEKRKQNLEGFKKFFEFIKQHKDENNFVQDELEVEIQTDEAVIISPEVEKVRKGIIDSAISGIVKGIEETMFKNKKLKERVHHFKNIFKQIEDIREKIQNCTGETMLEGQ